MVILWKWKIATRERKKIMESLFYQIKHLGSNPTDMSEYLIFKALEMLEK